MSFGEDMDTFRAAALALLVTLLVISWCGNWQKRWKYRHIPGPKPSFPLGNLKAIRKKLIFRAYTDWQTQFGSTFRVFFVRQPILVTTDPAMVRQITVKDFNKFHDRFIPGQNIGLLSGKRAEIAQSGMLVARGAFWGSLRAGVNPMFHSSHLNTYAATINKALDDFTVNLDGFARTGEQVDMFRQLGRMTMQVIGAAAFGVDFNTQQSTTDIPLIQAAKAVFDNSNPSFWALAALVSPRFLMPTLRFLSGKFPSKGAAESKDAFETIYDACDNLIENSRKKYNADSEAPPPWKWFPGDANSPYKETVPAENSVISMLQKANNKATGSGFTPLQIAAQANTMILAGYETTANTLAYSIYLLGRNPQAQQQLLQEVDAFPQQPGYDDLPSFPYAAAVINEALRLYPPATVLTRAASQDVQLGQYQIPKDTVVHINLWGMQHDEQYWPDAEAFKPERWVGDKTGGDKSGGMAYMPFGLGPRMCIGIKLALEEAIIALVRLYQRYTFDLSQDLLTGPLEVKQGITMSPKHGVPVKVVLRQNKADVGA